MSIQSVGFGRRRGLRKRRPIAFAAVAVKRKLRHHEQLAADFDDGSVHFSVIVFEDPQVLDLLGQKVGVGVAISFADAQKDAKSGADLADSDRIDRDTRLRDSLNDGTHDSINGFLRSAVAERGRANNSAKLFSHLGRSSELLTEIGAGDNKAGTIYSQPTFHSIPMRAPKLFFLLVGVTFTMVALPSRADLAALENRQEAGDSARVGVVTGMVFGKVSVAGRRQKPKPLPVYKNRSFCGPTVRDETLLIGPDGGLANAVVVFRSLEGRTSPHPGTLTLDNKQCAFTPHVQVGVVGSELLLKNSDPILHTVHARMGNETLFNVGLPNWRRVTKRLERAGVIKINCDVLHTWMSAAIVIIESPYFAVTDAAGAFTIDNLPAGEYDVEVWHERLGSRRQLITVSGDSLISFNVVYSPDQVR